MKSRSNPQQLTLTGVMQVQCACGCGQYFMAAVTPRMRQYINEAHKKRAARARAKARRENDRVLLQPRGWVYMHTESEEERDMLWQTMDGTQRALVSLMCEFGYSLRDLRQAIDWLSELAVD